MFCGLLWFFEGGKAAGAEVKAMPSVQLCAHKRWREQDGAEGEQVECAGPCSWLAAGSALHPASCWDTAQGALQESKHVLAPVPWIQQSNQGVCLRSSSLQRSLAFSLKSVSTFLWEEAAVHVQPWILQVCSRAFGSPRLRWGTRDFVKCWHWTSDFFEIFVFRRCWALRFTMHSLVTCWS